MAQRGVAGTAPLVPLLLITALGLCRGQQSTVAEEREGTCDLLTGANCKNEVHNPLELFAVQNLVVAGETPLEGSSRPAGPKLWTNITHYSKSGTWVEVWWSNVVNPRLDDLVALYVPADADPRKTAPVKFQYAFRSPTHRTLGAGHLRFKLLNLRQDVAFMFIRGGLQFPVVTAKSNTVRNTNPNEPLQGHLSLTGKAGQVLVQWATRDTGNPVARWGTKPGHYTHAAPATSVTYTSKELCGPPATGAGWAEPGMLHAAVVSGLEPRQKYYYVFGDEEFGWSEEGSFYGPVPADHRATVRLLAVADMGQAEEDGSNEVSAMLASRNTTGRLAQEVAQGGYDLLMHNGDISYARGYATQWDTFFDQLGPVVRSLPYMTTIGNHERDWPETGDRFPTQYDSGGECGIPYYRHTRMPTRSEDEHWYSFDMGPVHFLQYSTEHEFEPGSAQYKFMKEDLKGVDRSRTPWVVVGGHRPMYVDSTFGWPPDGDQYVATQLRDSLEPLLRKYAVDVTWHGHHHSYQRTCPVLAGQCVGQNADGSAAAPVHLIIGNAGFALSPNTWPQLPEIFEVVKLEYGYLRVTANATHMQHQMVSSSTGELIDEFTLTKPAGWLLSSAAASTVPLLESQGATQGVAARA